MILPNGPQLPIRAYFDQSIFDQEIATLFHSGPSYVGHEAMVPEPGSYITLAHENHGRMLVRGANGIELLSNVCRHRQNLMLQGQGKIDSILCPLHRWSYALDGSMIGAPHFLKDPCLNLKSTPLSCWNGLLFEGPAEILDDLHTTPFMEQLDFSGYVLDRVQQNQCDYNWKIFLEVYTDDYHVAPVHPGLSHYVDCTKLSTHWHLGKHFSAQRVGISDLKHAGTPVYQRWHEEMLRVHPEGLPPYGSIWMTIYPNVMVEWYPKTLVISTLWPKGPRSTINMIEFYYPEEIALFEPEFVKAHQAAYNETAIEDDEIAKRLDLGRRALMDKNDNQIGPYQTPMEDGMRHCHEYLHQHISYG